MSEVIHRQQSTKPYLLPAILQPHLAEHLKAMRYGTANTTPQAEYAMEALKFYEDLMRDFSEINIKAYISAKTKG
jgi:hypothetical protein